MGFPFGVRHYEIIRFNSKYNYFIFSKIITNKYIKKWSIMLIIPIVPFYVLVIELLPPQLVLSRHCLRNDRLFCQIQIWFKLFHRFLLKILSYVIFLCCLQIHWFILYFFVSFHQIISQLTLNLSHLAWFLWNPWQTDAFTKLVFVFAIPIRQLGKGVWFSLNWLTSVHEA